MSKPPWNGLRAAFYLVAALLMLQMFYIGVAIGWCVYMGGEHILTGKFECNKDGRLGEMMATIITTALAFAMAFLNGRDKDKEPPP